MRRPICVLWLWLLSCAPVAAQDGGDDIAATFDAFALSNAAASHCVVPGGAVLENFVPNFQRVSTSFAVSLKQNTPALTEAGITKIMQDRYGRIDAKVVQAIEQEGCDGPRIGEALAQFWALAKLDAAHMPKAQKKSPLR